MSKSIDVTTMEWSKVLFNLKTFKKSMESNTETKLNIVNIYSAGYIYLSLQGFNQIKYFSLEGKKNLQDLFS